MEYFWKKKLIVSYVLSVFVLWIHISSFGNYSEDGTMGQINNFVSDLFSHTFSEAAVPLFFMLSGALFFRNYSDKMYFTKIKARIYSLVIPYFVWNILGMIFEILTSYSFVSNYFVGREKFKISVENILLAIFLNECNVAFWFVLDLILFCLIAPVINFVILKKERAFAVIIALIVFAQFGIGCPDFIFTNKLSIVYYLLGCVIGKHYFAFWVIKSKKIKRIFSMLGVFACVFFYYLKWNQYISVPLLIEVGICVLLCYCMWNFFDVFIDATTERKFIGDSFFVYALHINVSAIVSKCYYLLFPKTNYFAIPNFVFSTITTLLCITVICRFLEKWFPKIYGVLSGGRHN